MRLPRFRIRTLMIAIGVVAITTWWITAFSRFTPLRFAPVGPVIGIVYIRSREPRHPLSYLFGSILGGLVEAFLLLTLSPLLLKPVDPDFAIWYTKSADAGLLPLVVMPTIAWGVLSGVVAWGCAHLSGPSNRLTNRAR